MEQKNPWHKKLSVFKNRLGLKQAWVNKNGWEEIFALLRFMDEKLGGPKIL